MIQVASVSGLFSTIVWLIFVLVGLYVYAALVRQINARIPAPELQEPAPRDFGVPELGVALVLISFLLLNVFASATATSNRLSSGDLVANLVLSVVVLLILIGFLELRRLHVDRMAGLSRYGIVRSIVTGASLLLAAYPLISLADLLTRTVEGSSTRQNIVELFSGSHTIQQRILIIVLAVAVAPIAEEFVFRFFLYGVLRRFIGRLPSLVFTALLFAAVHAHLPSFAPLFVLAVCFTLAYEWSGSILVSMTMHSLFNSLSLFFLAFPGLSDQ